MKQARMKFKVYRRQWEMADDEDASTLQRNGWENIGETWAVSEKQAVNNVRHRTMGDRYASQYLPTVECGHYIAGYQYMAVRAVDRTI